MLLILEEIASFLIN